MSHGERCHGRRGCHHSSEHGRGTKVGEGPGPAACVTRGPASASLWGHRHVHQAAQGAQPPQLEPPSNATPAAPLRAAQPCTPPCLGSRAEAEPITSSQLHTLTWQPRLPLKFRLKSKRREVQLRALTCSIAPWLPHVQPQLLCPTRPRTALCWDRALQGKP